MASPLECMAEAKKMRFNKYKCRGQQQSLEFTQTNAEWLQRQKQFDSNLCEKDLRARERELGRQQSQT